MTDMRPGCEMPGMEGCPFCGGTPLVVCRVETATLGPKYTNHFRAAAHPVCSSCGATLPEEKGEWVETDDPRDDADSAFNDAMKALQENAVERWNRRATDGEAS